MKDKLIKFSFNFWTSAKADLAEANKRVYIAIQWGFGLTVGASMALGIAGAARALL